MVVWPPPKKDRFRSHSVMSRSVTDPERIDEFRRQKELEREAIRREEERKRVALEKQVGESGSVRTDALNSQLQKEALHQAIQSHSIEYRVQYKKQFSGRQDMSQKST